MDCEDQLILECDLTNDANDVHKLERLLEAFEAQYGRKPRRGLFDAGYCSEANIALQDDAFELFIATTKEWKRRNELAEQGPPIACFTKQKSSSGTSSPSASLRPSERR